ncbi:hypothetical protein NEOLEDRAFT_1131683 [Neolentinus lepideus HHB14362 ss-1]|uniref:C2H2-type domain-containing protein n=1 Tax=Neolentinus lepideus HHB14362 ss-1 TaxID=1314782 RepID=A0A165THU4_9AGAM|nr:hypothetical protein NEOLEDRAFT_1131683 [Neolentinus lepideus HHB14362 ss-1]
MDVQPSTVWPNSAIKVSYPDAAYHLHYPSQDMPPNQRPFEHDQQDVQHSDRDNMRHPPPFQHPPPQQPPSSSQYQYHSPNTTPYSVPSSSTNINYTTTRIVPPPTEPLTSDRSRGHGSKVANHDAHFAPNAAALYAQALPPPAHSSHLSESGTRNMAGTQYVPMASMPRLPPILQVEKQQVTTSATQAASASRRRNEAHFVCPVPGCGSTFTRRFNLRGHLRSHTEERPYVCEWPGCGKGFARQHDCKRHQALHTQRSQQNVCSGCGKTFSRLDALNRHLRSEGGADCRVAHENRAAAAASNQASQSPGSSGVEEEWDRRSASADQSSTGRLTPKRAASIPPAVQAHVQQQHHAQQQETAKSNSSSKDTGAR